MATSKKSKKNRSQRNAANATATEEQALPWLWPTLAMLVIAGGMGLLLWMNRAPVSIAEQSLNTAAAVTVQDAAAEALPGPDAPGVTAPAGDAPAPLRAGRANYCQNPPTFPAGLGFDAQTFVGTSLDGYMGLTLMSPEGVVYQDESWDDAGFLGPFIYDRAGNIYTAPAPFVNLLNNAPADQNKIYRVDAATGHMAEWVDLPAARAPTQLNPFGILGLFYDCDTNSVFAGSVAGSTATEEVGRIFRVDQATGAVGAMYENVDAMGVGVFNGINGKRLYFGSGRDTGIRSIALDEAGNFVGEPRVEFYLAQFEEAGNEKAQRITFTTENQMVVKGLDFNYNLRAASKAVRVLYTFAYDPAGDSWEFVSIERK